MSQPIRIAVAPAPVAIFCGKLNTPEPTIDPMTNAVSNAGPSRLAFAVFAPDCEDPLTASVVVMAPLLRSLRQFEVVADSRL
jgi:hypothetical protein